MTLEEKILNDYKEAMKQKDSLKSSVLSFLRAQLMNMAIEKRKKALDDVEVIAAIKKQIKQHKDSIAQFKQGNRLDLVDKEEKELAILKSYLPEELPVEKIQEVIKEAVIQVGAQGIQDMGKVMKEVLSKIGAQADAKLVSDLVKEMLSGSK